MPPMEGYRRAAAATQLSWYATGSHTNHFLAGAGLFGLSAAEAPERDVYVAYGVGSPAWAANDGDSKVVTLHYSAMVSDIEPNAATSMWETLRDRKADFLTNTVVISPWNNMESMRVDGQMGGCTVNPLKGSWNLALQAEGWALADESIRAELVSAVIGNPFLRHGFELIKGDAPGWLGIPLSDCESVSGWTVECDSGSSGSISAEEGLIGRAIRLNWDIGSGSWVQVRHDFEPSIDLSGSHLFGVSLRGSTNGPANTIAVMLSDTNGVFYGYHIPAGTAGVNQVDRWVMNHPIPRSIFCFFWGPTNRIDWTAIDRLFVTVKRPSAGEGGGFGTLCIDHFQHESTANRQRPTNSWGAARNTNAAGKAISYLLEEQQVTGLFRSWKEEPAPKAWLYDQALVLIALTREGSWNDGLPCNQAAQACDDLVTFITGQQKMNGSWPRGWNPITGTVVSDDDWVGDQAWWIMALSDYSLKSSKPAAMASAKQAAAWLAGKIDGTGKVTPSTEGNIDTWWALISTFRFSDAEEIRRYLLNTNTVWSGELEYWWRGFNDPVVAMDAQTWGSAFARHPLVNRSRDGFSALGFARCTLITTSDDGSVLGFDGQGPVSVWNEGTAQYVAAGGSDADVFLDQLLAQQLPNGGMPGSPDSWNTYAFGWLTPWTGLAPTAWLYFALTGQPFSCSHRDADNDRMPDWQEFVAGTDPEDEDSFLGFSDAVADSTGQTFALSWRSVTGRTYCIRSTENLFDEWRVEPGRTNLLGTGDIMTCTNNTSTSREKYFRVQVLTQ